MIYFFAIASWFVLLRLHLFDWIRIRGLLFWRFIMPKGQQRGNKEAKKPKKDKPVVLPAGSVPLTPVVPEPRKKK